MKFKNIKPIRPKKPRAPKKAKENKAKKLQFPRISLIIPEKQEILHILNIIKKMTVVFAFTVMVIIVLFTAADLYRNYTQNQLIQSQRQKLIHEINIWKSFSDKYKDYKEVYFQIAVREFQLGDFSLTNTYLQKALFIDPNYEEALKLQKELENK